jgi:hypothetical protein
MGAHHQELAKAVGLLATLAHEKDEQDIHFVLSSLYYALHTGTVAHLEKAIEEQYLTHYVQHLKEATLPTPS